MLSVSLCRVCETMVVGLYSIILVSNFDSRWIFECVIWLCEMLLMIVILSFFSVGWVSRIVIVSSNVCVGCLCCLFLVLMIGVGRNRARNCGVPEVECCMTIVCGCIVESVLSVSIRDLFFDKFEFLFEMEIVSVLKCLVANSKLVWVRVEGLKNKLMIDLLCSVLSFLIDLSG